MKRIGACTRVIFRRESKLLMSSGPIIGRTVSATSLAEVKAASKTTPPHWCRDARSTATAVPSDSPVHDDLLGPTGLQKVLMRGLSVSIEPILRRTPSPPAVAAIVNHQNRGAGRRDLTEALAPMRDVSGIAVQEEGNAAAPRTGDKPAMDTDRSEEHT